MNNSMTVWKKRDHWTWREFVALLLLEFVFVIGVLKFAVKPVYAKWLGNELYAGTLLGLTIAIVLTLGVYLVALRPKRLSWSEVGLRSFSVKDWGHIVLFTLLLIVGSTVIMVLTSYIGNTYENSKTEAIQQNLTMFHFSIAFVSAAVISPIYEEIFYRGFIYRWLRTRIGLGSAILLSSLIFTIVHIPTYNAMPANFLGGVIFAWAYERTNSIWPGAIIHGLVNGVFLLLTVIG
ncbi:type II CAAX endopeptidase family protein [Paenibacillus motobuensis]|uniref:Type II CAAX endopeptidase family protein n=1 Tax=Paenibacillus motobuensis TaxID=295324 RepID=A0ABP3I2Q0_9BACL